MEKLGMKVFTGTANIPFAQAICDRLGVELGKADVSQFADGETSVKINETVRGYETFIVQSTSTPVNDHLMEVLIMADALKRASASKINLVLPYYGYARQDRKTRGREPITAKMVADLIETVGVDRVVTMDLHAGQIQGYFNIPVDHMTAAKFQARYFQPLVEKEPEKWVVASPDIGGVARARKFSHLLDLPIAIIEKIRPKPNVSYVTNVIGDVEGKNCILLDDIIDTAGTITNAARLLKESGAADVYITASHGVLSGPAVERIMDSPVKKCVITDSIQIPEEKKFPKLEVITLVPLLAQTIERIYRYESVSELFDA